MSHHQVPENSRTKQVVPYGDWPSAITAELIVSDGISLDEPKITDTATYYIERRPQENGRCVIVRATRNNTANSVERNDILPTPYSARSRVHEYGGGCYCVDTVDKDLIYFINDSDQDIYAITSHQIRRITDCEHLRFADISIDHKRQQLIAVCEDHRTHSVINSLVSINIDNGSIRTLVQGDDFYASPRLDTNCNRLCWQSWNLPNMPWDGNRLWLAELGGDGQILHTEIIAGSGSVSVFQPQWSPDDQLYFIADESGWWQLYCYRQTGLESGDHETDNQAHKIQLSEGDKEFGLPQWVFGQSTYAFIDKDRILCCYQEDGRMQLAIMLLPSFDNMQSTANTYSMSLPATLHTVNTRYQEFSAITASGNPETPACFIAASGSQFPSLVSLDPAAFTAEYLDPEKDIEPFCTVVKHSCQLAVGAEHFSTGQTIAFQNRRQQTVYANYYPPCNPACQADAQERPPMIVICHGGPTGQSGIALDPRKQFWTSRGFALLDVNYSGSTGYGRDYRQRLDKNWGILDVQDCCDAANHAVASGMADADRLIIRGSSAGGYTVLCALTFHDVFSAGASYYGISELSTLTNDTHKFESGYLDQLIGPYPDDEAIYRQRSPIEHADMLNCPVIFFQGIDDRVVPKQQAEKMFRILNDKGLPVAAQYFAGEQHGFRKAETITQSLQNELGFYQLVFDIKPADKIKFCGDVTVRNAQTVRSTRATRDRSIRED